jgi:peptide/nickel transport system substrate-binding protein
MKKQVGLIILGSLALIGLGLAQKSGGILRAGMQADPVGLDPHTTNATATRNQLENVYDTLVRFDPKGKIIPSLALNWRTSADGLTWTFNMRPGVAFHNGRALDSTDVAFSINRIKDPAVKSPRATAFDQVSSITTPNRTTVVFKLKQPFSPLLSKLAFSLNVIIPKEAVATINTKPVGTGPFIFSEYIPSTRMVLKRNPSYWERDAKGNKLPYLDGITYSYLPDATARSTALRTGNVDWIEYVPAADIATIKRDPKLEVVGGLSANFRSLYMNLKEKPLDDVRVRQAIAYAINPKEVVDVALFGTGGVVAKGSTIPSGGFYSFDRSPYGTPNLEKAKALLKEAGFPNGFSLDLKVTSTYDFLRTPAEVLQAQLAKIGINLKIQAEEWSVYLPNFIGKRYVTTIIGNSGQGDPDDYLYEVYHTKGGGDGNLMNFSDAQVDRLLEQGRIASKQEDRKAIYDQVQERVLQLVPMVPLFHSAQYEGIATYVKGFEHYANSSYLGLRTTYLDK